LKQDMNGWLQRSRSRGVAAQSAVLVLALLVAYVVVAPVAGSFGGRRGLATSAAAAGFCLLGAGSAWIATRRFSHPSHALLRLLIAIPLRTGLPLVLGLMYHLRGGVLAEAGVLVYLLAFYPVTLGVETILSLLSLERPPVLPALPETRFRDS